MSEFPPKSEKEKRESEKENQDSEEQPPSMDRIVILEERDIPFEEERPPNFSPHFEIKIHRAHRRYDQEEPEE
jgi:hypothetical protein